jgi:hypothetical protein
LISGLVIVSVLSAVVAGLLIRGRLPRRAPGPWEHDWLADVITTAQRIPVMRRLARPEIAPWARRRAVGVFVVLSLFAAVIIVGGLAYGERWTDPMLLLWALTVQTTSILAFCFITNAVAGFIARPQRSRRTRIAEGSVLTGGVVIQAATAFHDELGRACGIGAVTTVPALAAITLSPGVIAALITAAVLWIRRPSLPLTTV